MKYKVGFIGCGNMGGALIKAVSRSLQKGEIAVCDQNAEKTNSMEKEYGAIPVSAEEIAKYADFVVLGVKPQVLQEALSPIATFLQRRSDVTIVTMAAGISISAVQGFIQKEVPGIRIMPNTPVAVGEGMITFARNSGVSDESVKLFTEILSYAGRLDEVSESVIDAATAVAGCGPAFVYMFAEALADAGVFCGLTREKAITYAAETIKGAASMMLKTDKHPAKLRDEVCSPGGSTIVGVHALEDGGFRAAVEGAVIKAYKKTKELG